jgi:cytochrome P450
MDVKNVEIRHYDKSAVWRLPMVKLLKIARKMNGPMDEVFTEEFFEQLILQANLGFQKIFFIADTGLLRAMLQRPANFDRSDIEQLQAGDFGDLAVPYGEAYLAARANMAVVFKKHFAEIFYRWAGQVADEKIEVLLKDMSWTSVYRFAHETAKLTAFRSIFGEGHDVYFDRFVDLLTAADNRMMRLDAWKIFVPLAAKLWTKRSTRVEAAEFNGICASLLQARKPQPDSAGAEILPSNDWLLAAGLSTNYCNVLGLFLLMSDNLEYAIYWMIHYLASESEVYAKAFDETLRLHSEELVSANRARNYLDAVADETLRVRPSVPMIGRVYRPTPDMPADLLRTCDGLGIRAEDTIVISTWILHHHKAYWRSPQSFDPDRFLAGNEGEDNPAYMPFGYGRRGCPGARMATRTLAIVLERFLRRFPSSPLPPSPSRPLFYLSLVPSHVRDLP